MSEKLYVVILNYNSANETIALFHDLNGQSFTDFKIIVVDNNSKHNDQRSLKEFIPKDNLKFLAINKGYASGNKVGILEALKSEVPFVLLLNPDIRLHVDCIKKLLQTLEQNKAIAVVGPRICYRKTPNVIYSDGGLINKAKGMYTYHLNYNENVEAIKDESGMQSVDYVNGSVFFARTSIFKAVGLMREDFFLYFEETEWCMRAKDKGYELVTNTDALAFHSSSSKSGIYHYYMTRNRLLLAKLYPQYYRITKNVVWQPLSKKITRSIKTLSLPDSKLRAQIMGYIVGRMKRIR